MAKIVFDAPDGVAEEEVAAQRISDSGKVRGVRLKLDDGSYLHVPDTRLYSIAETEQEGRIDSTPGGADTI